MMNFFDLLDEKGTALDKQKFTWKEMVKKPISKLDDDAFTRVRIILMNGIEMDALRLKQVISRFNGELRLAIADICRVEHHQATMINWLISADHSPLETTLAYEQTAIEVTAAVAQTEPDPYQAQTYRFGLLEDFDHLYRYAAMLDRLEGKDPNHILQCYTDIIPGRLTSQHHRAPLDDIRFHYDHNHAELLTKIHAAMITAAEYQTHDYYMTIGPTFADPLARQLYAEIASVEIQHVTQYGSLIDPNESFLEKWLLHELMEVYAYYSCMEKEPNHYVKNIWERFLDYELGHLQIVKELFKKYEHRDPQEIMHAKSKIVPLEFKSNRKFVREVLAQEVNLRAKGMEYVAKEEESQASKKYRADLNAEGVASEIVSAGYQWCAGTELNRQ